MDLWRKVKRFKLKGVNIVSLVEVKDNSSWLGFLKGIAIFFYLKGILQTRYLYHVWNFSFFTEGKCVNLSSWVLSKPSSSPRSVKTFSLGWRGCLRRYGEVTVSVCNQTPFHGKEPSLSTSLIYQRIQTLSTCIYLLYTHHHLKFVIFLLRRNGVQTGRITVLPLTPVPEEEGGPRRNPSPSC